MAADATVPLNSTSDPDMATHARLRGAWLVAGAAVWIVLVALTLITIVAAIPPRFRQLTTVSPQADTSIGELVPGDALALEGLGLSPHFYALYFTALEAGVALAFVGVAGVIFWRRLDHRMAFFFSLALMLFGANGSPLLDSLVAIRPEWRLPAAILRGIGQGAAVPILYIFPSGRFKPRWTRWLAVAWMLFIGLGIAAPQFRVQPSLTIETPLEIGLWMWMLAVLISVGAVQVYRYRHVYTPLQKQQTKWIVLGLVLMMGIFLLASIPFILFPVLYEPGATNILVELVAFTAVLISELIFALTIAASILRYRLWDIDFVINRSLVYGGLTAILVVVFAGAFLALRALTEAVLGEQQAIPAAVLSTAGIVALFSPVRRTMRSWIDKNVYGIQVEYRTPPGERPAAQAATRTSLGPYQNLEPLGSGGMAEVYRARHPAQGHAVALKVLPARLAGEEEFRRRFEREARVVSRLEHPNIVRLYDYGEVEGTYYMALEYIDGSDLGRLLRQRGPLLLEESAAIIKQIASALDYAHGQSLVHRDIKPSNVMLEGNHDAHRAVLTDFGIAKIVTGGTQLTHSRVVGTFDYMAPEQIQAAENIDGRADIYALGCMAYEMLTGELPFKYQNPAALLIAHLYQPAPDPRSVRPDLPEWTAEAILRTLEKDPAQRFATAGEFAAAMG